MQTYCKVIANQIVEFPVYDLHIANRGDNLNDYFVCDFDKTPQLEFDESVSPIFEIDSENKKVFVTWEIVKLSQEKLQKKLETEKEKKKLELESKFQEYLYAPIEVNGHLWEATKQAQDLISNVLLLANFGIPLPPVWRDCNGNDVEINSIEQLKSIASAIKNRTENLYYQLWQKKTLVDNATSYSELASINW